MGNKEVLEALLWDGEAELIRAVLRNRDTKMAILLDLIKQLEGGPLVSSFGQGKKAWVFGLVSRPSCRPLHQTTRRTPRGIEWFCASGASSCPSKRRLQHVRP
ncbi:unnamed protein product [Vitrella brassicaformis CCMP3155]|uniref:Uncharacterized protein n=1 Tax=Vitrella brassicaformis (strain CCMP3155) TaxID=1169540 RepID=A0A0G4F6E9_VITBC|nr:unnamed protein product [Vitrella brassicaformis CCMP3155]|eukprot:CEM07983.1 unnamed protein product [Vitrella brassicaformis CCMP3155]